MFATLEKQLAWAHIGTMAAHISVHRLAKLLCVGMNSTHSPTTTHQARLLKGILYITWEKRLISIYICCPNLEIIHEKVDINSSCEMEILIRHTAPDEPRVYFPIFANRGDGEQFERRFLGLFDSRRPRSFESQPWKRFVVKWNSLLSEGRVDNSSDQFFTRGVGWNDYLVPGMYVTTLL